HAKDVGKIQAYDMLEELKTMFEEQAKQEPFETVKAFHAYKQEEVSHMGKTIAELHAMLKLHEKGAKGKDKGKNNLAYAPKPKIPPPPKRENPARDSVCHHYKEVGHWRRKCPSYQAKLKRRKNSSMASTSGYGTHICNTLQGLRRSKKLKHRALSLYMGNGIRAAVEAIGSFDLILPSYPKETTGYYFYYPPENKIFVTRNAEFFENSLIVQEASGSHGPLKMSGSDEGLELIQEEDTQPSENTSEEHNEVMPIELPPNSRIVRSKWLFKKKTDMDCNIHTFKARLVEKGYTQTYGVDYRETFSLFVDIRAIRILLAIASFYDYEIWQMDVKTAFLNGHLSEDVYMLQPEGLVDPNHPNKVCKLQRSIYGLKQASRSWNKRFDVEIKKIGFTQNPDEPCVYLKASGSSVAFLILYVDDILLMRNNVTMLQEVKSWLSKCFSMKDLGELAYILGIKIIRDRMENSKKVYTPMMEKPYYRKSQGAKTPSEIQRIQRVPYALAIGSIVYAVRDMVLMYGAKPEAELKESCYADASFQTDKDDTKSQTGYVFVLNGGAVDWKSAKQSTTAMSFIEAEYIVVAEASMEAVWMRKFIDGLGDVVPSSKRPM
ncbi:retrotransposon protein, putative, ty1-copia subclass, partial [Tanacetum coccineum]